MHEGLPLPVFKCGSEKMVWREKERSTISNVQVDNLRDFLGIPNARFREMYEVKKRVDVKCVWVRDWVSEDIGGGLDA